jgi:hypothetical protein
MLNKAERNYCITRWELLAIVRPLEHFYKYLYRQELNLRPNHSALTCFMNFKNFEGQTAKWIQRLQEYNFTSTHNQGWKHNDADALSDSHAEKSANTVKKLRCGQKSSRCKLLGP